MHYIKLKSFLKKIIGQSLTSLFFMIRMRLSKYKGCFKIDQQLEVFMNYDKGFFVELGANDGVSYSNTYYFEEHRNWSGICIEPVPENYIKCISNRKKTTYVFPYACVSFAFKDMFVPIIYANFMSTPLRVESDIKNKVQHSESEFIQRKNKKVVFGALAKTLNEILISANAPKEIDLLSLDVEGGEIEVLKGVNHNKFRFHYICIEARNFKKIERYLMQNNYRYVKKLSPHDYLFVNNKK